MHTMKLAASRARTITSVVLIAVSTLVAHLHSQVTTVAKKIPEKQAEYLLKTYLRSKGYDSKDARLDIEVEQRAGKGADLNFYLYDVYVDTPQRLVTIGSYGVNARTGDIWERIECRRIESDAVASLQRKIRDSSGLSPGELRDLESATPCFDAQGASGDNPHPSKKQ